MPYVPRFLPACQGNHIFTSGATGTNAAVIRGALRAENQDLLTVVLPQVHIPPADTTHTLRQPHYVAADPPHSHRSAAELCRPLFAGCAELEQAAGGEPGAAAAGKGPPHPPPPQHRGLPCWERR